MSACPQLPQPGDRVSAGLTREIIHYERENAPVQGPGVSLARGPNGTTISLTGEMKPKRPTHFPFEVAGSSESHYKFAVFVPEGAVTIGGTVITPTGITAITGELDVSGWYHLDDEDQVTDEEAMLYLIAYDNQTAKFSFDIDGAGATSGSASAPSIVSVLPIAVLSVQEIGEQSSVGVVHRQLARHPFTVGVGGGGEVYDSKVTIYRYDGTTVVGSFTVNQGEDSSIILPQIPAVSDETIVIAKSDGTTIDSFTLNQSPGKTIRLPPIPDVPSPPTDYVTSISDLDLSVENPTSAQPSLKISFKYNLKNGNSVPVSKSLNLMRDDVVRSSEYSTSTHKLVNKVSKATVFGLSAVADATPPVFQATPHSGEH